MIYKTIHTKRIWNLLVDLNIDGEFAEIVQHRPII